jgi:DnaJ-class molecular chaperone
MNGLDYAKGFGEFLGSIDRGVRKAWDEGRMVPCDECAGNGYVPVSFNENASTAECPKCHGERWVK